MQLSPGSRVGSYEVVALLGAGGMGAVYSARDTRLGRAVALKVILDTFSKDAERVARFEREAKMLASLNHPRIASLFGMEQDGDQHFLVMELIDGETLADRLRRGPMPLEDALGTAVQIAEALEAAHERGVVHRDLKPANIKITSDKQVKVLDFGLAKAVETPANAAEMANSPTLSMMATQAGVILGTAAYMSPEQAKGFNADHRSDVFSFGTVLFEMLTGRQPFQGETAPDVLASVLVREPDLATLPADVNPRLVELLRRCLQKSPKKRWQAIGDVRAELESLLEAPRSAIAVQAAHVPAPFWKRVLVPAAATLVIAAATGVAAWSFKPETPARIVRFGFDLSEGQTWAYLGRQVLDISPDGSTIAYTAMNRLYVRRLSELHAEPLAAAASIVSVTAPVFSPDGRFVSVHAGVEGALKRVPVGGGPVTTIAQTPNPLGVTWIDADTILYVNGNEGILKVAATGGKPELLVAREGEARYYRPSLLQDGETLLFTLATGTGNDRWEKAQVVAHSLRTKERKVLVDGAGDGRLLPTGHLAYAQAGVVYAAPFDQKRLEVTAPAVPILEGVLRAPSATSAAANYAVARDGTLVYVPGPVAVQAGTDSLAISDIEGRVTALKLPRGSYGSPRASRDGKRVVYEDSSGANSVVYVYDLDERSAPRRLTFRGNARLPIFTPDGTRVTFSSDHEGPMALYSVRADGSGGLERLTQGRDNVIQMANDWSFDGRTLLYSTGEAGDWTLWAYSADTKKSIPVPETRTTSLTLLGATFSPDGKWFAYSVRSGPAATIYVQPFPTTGAKYEVPRPPGTDPHHPVWLRDGSAMVYTDRPGGAQIIPVNTRGAFTFGLPALLKRGYQTQAPSAARVHDVLPGNRFVGHFSGAASSPDGSGPQLLVVINWLSELNARLGG